MSALYYKELSKEETLIDYKKTRDDFYNLCEHASAVDIRKCFINKRVRDKLSFDILAYGFFMCGQVNNWEAAQELFICTKKYMPDIYDVIELKPMINVAISNNHLDFVEKSYLHTKWYGLLEFKNDSELSYSLTMLMYESPIEFSYDKVDKGIDEIGLNYNKHNYPVLNYVVDRNKSLNFLLEKDIHSTQVGNILHYCFKSEKKERILEIFESKYIHEVIERNDFLYFKSKERTEFKVEMLEILEKILKMKL